MAKSKSPSYNNLEEARAAQANAQEEVNAAKVERRKFAKDNGLDPKGDHSSDKKHGKKWAKFTEAIDQAQAGVDAAATWITQNEPEGKAKKTRREPQAGEAFARKYTYPDDCVTDQQRKAFRTRARAEAAGKVPRAAAPKVEKVSKKTKKAAPVESDDEDGED